MVTVLNLFRRKQNEKWHDVRWRNGNRHIFLSLRFATEGEPPARGSPTIEKLPASAITTDTTEIPDDASGGTATADTAMIIRAVEEAVAEYNRMNRCALRVASIRYWATGEADHVDHGTATRKLLNLL
jgi:hypothetical protein